MKYDYRIINKIINSKWSECINYIIDDKDTYNFINCFLKEYYIRVGKGLIDCPYNIELRKKYFEELLGIIKYKECLIYINISDCLNDINNDKNTESILINNIFKLQSCKDIEWI